MTNNRELPTLGIIIPCFNEEEVIETTVKAVNDLLQTLMRKQSIASDSFALYVDDGSCDSTWDKILNTKKEMNVKALRFSKNFGHQSALLAGHEYCAKASDINICIDADLQHDISKIPEFIQKYKEGHDIVYGIKNNRGKESILKRIASKNYYRFLKVCGVNIIRNHADFRLMSKKATHALLEHRERNLFLRGLIPNIGFKSAYVYYNALDRFAGKSKYNFKKMLSLALAGLTSQTILPLRFLSLIGFLTFGASLIMSLYVTYQKIIGEALPGWASIVIPIYFIGGIQLMGLGIIGEYLGKIYLESRKRPHYILEEVYE